MPLEEAYSAIMPQVMSDIRYYRNILGKEFTVNEKNSFHYTYSSNGTLHVCTSQIPTCTKSATGASASAQQTTTFSDLSGKDCENAVNALVKAGIINGFSDGTFRPDAKHNARSGVYAHKQGIS